MSVKPIMMGLRRRRVSDVRVTRARGFSPWVTPAWEYAYRERTQADGDQRTVDDGDALGGCLERQGLLGQGFDVVDDLLGADLGQSGAAEGQDGDGGADDGEAHVGGVVSWA